MFVLYIGNTAFIHRHECPKRLITVPQFSIYEQMHSRIMVSLCAITYLSHTYAAWGNFSALAMELLQSCSEPSHLSKILFHWCSIGFTCKRALGKQCKYQLYQLYQQADVWSIHIMMVSSNGSIFSVTGHLCGEFTGHRWIPRTKASEAELWCLLWSVP